LSVDHNWRWDIKNIYYYEEWWKTVPHIFVFTVILKLENTINQSYIQLCLYYHKSKIVILDSGRSDNNIIIIKQAYSAHLITLKKWQLLKKIVIFQLLLGVTRCSKYKSANPRGQCPTSYQAYRWVAISAI